MVKPKPKRMQLADQARWLLILPIRMGTRVTVTMIHRGEKHSATRHFLELLVDTSQMDHNNQCVGVGEMLDRDGARYP